MEPTEYISFVTAAFIMGFLAAIPAGPVQIEVARRAINGHVRSSFMVILGAFTVDVLYGVIAFFGIAPFLKKDIVMAAFWLIGGIFLLSLSYIIIINKDRQRFIGVRSKHIINHTWGFVSGFTLSAVNPMLIFWWLMGQRLFIDVGLIEYFNINIYLFFLAAAGLGLASYLTVLSLFLYWTKQFISANKMQWINFAFGIVLLLIGVYFIFRSIRVVL